MLAVMLPTYFSDSEFFKETECIDWTNLEAYKDMMRQQAQIVNQHLFENEYLENIT